MVALTTRTRFRNLDSRVTPKNMVIRHLEQKTREKHFAKRDRLGEKLTLVVLAVKHKGKGRAKETKDCNQWVSKGTCSRGLACSYKHDLAKIGTDRKYKEVHQLRQHTNPAVRMRPSAIPAIRMENKLEPAP